MNKQRKKISLKKRLLKTTRGTLLSHTQHDTATKKTKLKMVYFSEAETRAQFLIFSWKMRHECIVAEAKRSVSDEMCVSVDVVVYLCACKVCRAVAANGEHRKIGTKWTRKRRNYFVFFLTLRICIQNNGRENREEERKRHSEWRHLTYEP